MMNIRRGWKNCGLILWLIFVCASAARAQAAEIKIEILSPQNAAVRVTGKTSAPSKNWTFADFYASAADLSRRIENPQFFDERGIKIQTRQTAAGKYETAAPAANFAYEIKLTLPAENAANAAHVSTLTAERALLMTADLLPELTPKTARINFVAPSDWRVATSETRTADNQFQVENIDRAVFLLGKFSESSIRLDDAEISAARVGEWSFSDAETLDAARQILAAHREIFGALPARKIQILMLPLQQKFGGESWQAETRGATLTLLAGDAGFKSRALSKLHEQLRHELFHLWLPNDLNLSGDYAWFYEGFTIYQALKTGVRLKYIRFDDFLDTMSRAFDVSSRAPQNKTLNLLEASRLRWTLGAGDFIYAKGMAIAFLCDLALLDESGGKKSLDSIFRELHQKHGKSNARTDANAAVLAILKTKPELRATIEKYVETTAAFDVQTNLNAAGLRNVPGRFARLALAEKLSGRQRKTLEKLGYDARFQLPTPNSQK